MVLAAAACLSAGNTPLQSSPTFDGTRALEHVRQLVAIGPRPAGSAAAQKTRAYIGTHLKTAGWSVEEQSFDARTPLGTIAMANIRATRPGRASGPRLIIAGHYDTKRFQQFAFVGANDGGSSTAFLLELARVLPALDTANPAGPGLAIELLFLDGEEAVVEWRANDHTYGSRHYVHEARRTGDLKNIRAFVLVDMIGDRDLRIARESQSTPWLTDVIWATARRLQRPEFVDESMPVDDDHIEFLKAGVPAVDVIDFDYPAWHTADDTVDRISAGSLQAVGEVLLGALPEIKRRAIAVR